MSKIDEKLENAEQALNNAAQEAKEALSQAESALENAKEEGGEKLRALKEKLNTNLQTAKTRICEFESLTRERAATAAKTTDAFVHENPWKVLGAGVALGFLVGILSSRK